MTRLGPAADVIDGYLGDVLADRRPDGEHGQRWGTGDVKISRVDILDAAGQSAKRIRTGDTIVFRAHWTATKTIERPVFQFGVTRVDGVDVSAPNTRSSGVVPETILGDGHTDLRVDRLMLLPGTYDLSASVMNFSQSHAYDARYRTFRFDVERGDPDEEGGIVTLGGQWDSPTPD